MPHGDRPYPHPGACAECRADGRCNYCGHAITRFDSCTNGRCGDCHSAVCTPGGLTTPGHGFGRQGAEA